MIILIDSVSLYVIFSLCKSENKMEEKKYSLNKLEDIAFKFVEDRNWTSHHDAKNSSINIVREASELAELFIWTRNKEETAEQAEKLRQAMEDEAGDVLFALLCFCRAANVDLEKAFLHKVKKAEKKYPLDKSSYEDFNKIKYGKK